MKALIADGYTRHVEIGDDIAIPRIELKYRPPRGPLLNELPFILARAGDSRGEMNKLLAEQIEWWDFEDCENHEPDAETLAQLDGHAYKRLIDVVFNGQPPDVIFDRPDQDNRPEGAAEQAAVDSGNL